MHMKQLSQILLTVVVSALTEHLCLQDEIVQNTSVLGRQVSAFLAVFLLNIFSNCC